jgi:trimeric autotransporter adhesin
VVREAPVVGQLLGQIGTDIGELARDLEPLGGSELDVLNVFAQAIGDIANVSPGLVQAAAGLYTLSKAASLLGISSAGVSGFVSDLSRLPLILNGAGGAASGLGKIAAYAGTAVSGLATLGLTLGDIAGPAGIAAAAILSFTHVMSAGLDSESGSATAWVKSFSEGLLQVRNPIQATEQEIKTLQATTTAWAAEAQKLDALAAKGKETNAQASQYQQLGLAIEQAKDKIVGLQTVLKTLQTNQTVSNSAIAAGAIAARGGASAADQLAAAAKTAAASFVPATGGAISLAGALRAMNAAADTSNLAAYKSAVGDVTTATSDASTAMTNFTNALNINGGTQLAATAAVTAAQQALQSAQTAIAGSTTKLEGNSTAALAAQSASESFAQQLRDTTEAQLASGQSATVVAASNKSLVAAFDATAIGANAPKSAVDALNKTLGLTPLTKKTTLSQDGAQAVTQAAKTEFAALEKLQATFNSNITQVGGDGVIGEAHEVYSALETLQGLNVTSVITTVHDNVTNNTTNTTSTGGGSPGPKPHAIGTSLGNVTSAARSGLTNALGINLGDLGPDGGVGGVPHGGAHETVSYAAQIASAKAALAAERQMAASIAANIESEDSIILGPAPAKRAVSGASPTHPGGTQKQQAPPSIIATLKKDAAQMKEYNADLKKLKKLGLSYYLLQELAEAGPEAGMSTAQQLLAGGKDMIDQADRLQGVINRNSQQIGAETASAELGGKQVGEGATEGIIKGLEAKQKQSDNAIHIVLGKLHKQFDADLAANPFDIPLHPTKGSTLSSSDGSTVIHIAGSTFTINTASSCDEKTLVRIAESMISQYERQLTQSLTQALGRGR